MNKGYEERYLIQLLSAVMNQKTPPEPMRQLSWEKLFRLADYHNVAHVAYYGIIGLTERIPQHIRQKFFDKYLEAVYRPQRLKESEKQIKALMEIKGLNCFVLDYKDIVKCYPIEEMCCSDSIEIGVEKKQEYLVKSTLERVDFEERQSEGQERLFYRVPGVRVVCYNKDVFFGRPMRKYYKKLLKTLPHRKGFQHVRELSANDKYLFYMCRLTDCYARGDLSLSQILDFWVFYKKNAKNFQWPPIYEKLEKLKIAEFAEHLEYLTLRWFGSGAGIQNVEIYDAMESYILTKGAEGREISSKLLPLIKTAADCYNRDRREESFQKALRWLFPDREYMVTLYPVLETREYLLPCYWGLRLGRYGVEFIRSGIKKNVADRASGAWKGVLERRSAKRLKHFEEWQERLRLREELLEAEPSDGDVTETNAGKEGTQQEPEAKTAETEE